MQFTYEQATKLVESALAHPPHNGSKPYQVCATYPVPTLLAICRALAPTKYTPAIGEWVAAAITATETR